MINGEYIDLALLLENTTISEKQEKQVVIIDGVLSTRDKTKQIINTVRHIFSMPVPEPLLPPKRTVCIYFNNAWYFEGCADEYMLIYTIKASVHFEIVLTIFFVLSLVESTPLIITIALGSNKGSGTSMGNI
jgi:hypothetical protein